MVGRAVAARWVALGALALACALALALGLRGCGHKKPEPPKPEPPKPKPSPSPGKPAAGLQTFDWDSLSDRSKLFAKLRPRAKDFAEAGFSHVWTPPPSKSADAFGYLPNEWYAIINGADLAAFTSELSQRNVTPVCDLVLNHRTGTEKAQCNGNYLIFSKPDWDSQAIVSDDHMKEVEGVCIGDLQCSGSCKCGAKDTGLNFCGAADVDHTREQVRNDVVQFMQWLQQHYHFGGWRFDMVKGYGGDFVKEYVNRTGGGFAVGEFLGADTPTIKAWVGDSGQPAFDFPQRDVLKEVMKSGDYTKLASPPGVAGWSALASHALLDDHDTARPPGEGTGGDGGFGSETAQLLGYVYILTHPPFPWVFLQHLDGANREAIRKLVAARRMAEISPQDPVQVVSAKSGLYAAVVGAKGNCSGKLAVRIGDEATWAPCGLGWQSAGSGEGWAVWHQGSVSVAL